MAFDVSELPAYTETDATQQVTKTLFLAKTAAKIKAKGNVKTGVKKSENIGVLDTDVIFQDGSGCGFTPQGTTDFSEREIEVGRIKVQEALCPKDHEGKYTQQALKAGSKAEYNTEVYAEEYTELKVGKTAEALEKAIWQGDKESGDPNLNKFDGFLKIIDEEAGVVDVTPAGPITSENAIAVIDAVFAAIPDALLDKDDLEINLGFPEFKAYIAALRLANLFHIPADMKGFTFMYPGTSIPISATQGLSSTNRVIALRWSNTWLGTDMENEEEKYELFFAKEADQVRFDMQFKYGVQIGIPEEVVSYQPVED